MFVLLDGIMPHDLLFESSCRSRAERPFRCDMPLEHVPFSTSVVVASGAEDGIYFSSEGLPGLAPSIADDFAIAAAAASELSFATGVPLLAIPGGGRGVDADPD
jgi:hypothetical protein